MTSTVPKPSDRASGSGVPSSEPSDLGGLVRPVGLPGRVVGWFAPVVPDSRIAILRSVLYLFVLLDIHLFVNDPPTLSRDPSLYRPLWFERMLHLPTPNPSLVSVLYVVLWVGCLIGAANRLPRLAGYPVAAAFTWWVAIGFSFGKVDHDHVALTLALWLLPTVGPVAGRWRSTNLSAQAGWALRGIQFAVIATYFLAGITKLHNTGWLLWVWPNSLLLSWAIVRRPHGLGQFFLPYPWVLRVMQWISFAAELSSVVILWLRGRALMFAALFWIGFHVFTVALIYIHFLPTVICWLAFAPLERLAPWGRRRFGRASAVAGNPVRTAPVRAEPVRTEPVQEVVEPGGGSAQAGVPPGR